MSKAVCCLGIYAVITTIIIAILSWIISADIACSLVTNVTGTDNKIKTSNNYEFLSFDNRSINIVFFNTRRPSKRDGFGGMRL